MLRLARRFARSTCALLIALVLASSAHAQRLAFRSFGIADGLANAAVNDVYEDSHGFVWIATWEGLSRFDGEQFVNFGAREGLGTFLVTTVTEDANGRLWVGTNGAGLARLKDGPGSQPPFELFDLQSTRSADAVGAIVFASDGSMWCATDAGLYHGVFEGTQIRFECKAEQPPSKLNWKHSACTDRSGALWFEVNGRILREARGELREVVGPEGKAGLECALITVDRAGRVLAVYPDALFALDDPREPPQRSDAWRRVPLRLEGPTTLRWAVGDADEDLWVATSNGLVRLSAGVQHDLGIAQGLPDTFVRTVSLDRSGHLWVGTDAGGVARLSDASLQSFSPREVAGTAAVDGLVALGDGAVLANVRSGGLLVAGKERIESVPGFEAAPFDTMHGRVLRDALGGWWLGTNEALYHGLGRVPEAATIAPIGAERGFTGRGVGEKRGLIAADNGEVYVGTRDGEVWRFDPGGHPTRVASGFPEPIGCLALGPSGEAWFGGHERLARWRGGSLELIDPRDGLPETRARALLVDRRGRMWVGLRYRGVSVVDDPFGDQPRFRNLGAADGLASEAVFALAEAPDGALWLGTGRGLHRLDPESGAVRVWTSADGLAGDVVRDLLFEPDGALWIATTAGLTRWEPPSEHDDALPVARIVRASAGGEVLPIESRGARRVAAGEIAATRNNLEIDFVAPSSRGGRNVAYQTKLEGADAQWSRPMQMRSVHYAQLAAGEYRFLVRACDLVGSRASEPAVLEFAILPPFWRQAWFVGTLIAVIAAAAWLAHRTSVARAVALERVRRQIALDLHDDLGAGLAQIAIQSEVARREVGAVPSTRLERIAELSRSLRSSMDDIVWAIDPRKDHASDLVQRMRRTVGELGEGDGPQIELRGPESLQAASIDIAPDRRRHVFLIFKEALTNATRHASASRIEVEVELGPRELHLCVRDDGRGFDPNAARTGRGLSNLARRAAEIDARLAIDSGPGRGTRIDLRVPLKPRSTGVHPHNDAVGPRARRP